MNQLQKNLVWSWFIGISAVSVAIFMGETSESYAWVVPMFIGIPMVQYLRKNIENEKYNILQHMGGAVKIFSLVYFILLGGAVIYYLNKKPDVVGNNTGILIILVSVPLIITAIKIELNLYSELK